MAGLNVGEVARRAGVELQTVHYYERLGLLAKPPRTHANYRAYPAEAVRRVRFIKRAQDVTIPSSSSRRSPAPRAESPFST